MNIDCITGFTMRDVVDQFHPFNTQVSLHLHLACTDLTGLCTFQMQYLHLAFKLIAGMDQNGMP